MIPLSLVSFTSFMPPTQEVLSGSYLVEVPLGQQDGAHGLGALVVGGPVLVRISIPPAGLSALPSPGPVGAGSAHLVWSQSARGSSTHPDGRSDTLKTPEKRSSVSILQS